MQNSNRTLEIINNPKFQLIDNLFRRCYTDNANHSAIVAGEGVPSHDSDGPRCPRTFDGFSCWDETPASTTAYQSCPEFIVGFDQTRFAYKRCTENGTWYVHPEANKTWTNYTTCVDVEDLDFRSVVNNIYVAGYLVSVAALLLSLAIFVYFRSLQCTRIRVHMHLFASFTLNNIMWIVWYRMVVNRVAVVQDNKEWCQVLHIITHYFMVSSYIWMFCEGLHLHIALVVVFVKDNVAMRWFIVIGWGLPVLIVAAYASVRYVTPGATERCWIDHSDTIWIIAVPVMASLLTSFAERHPLLDIGLPSKISTRTCLALLASSGCPRVSPVFLVNVVRVLVTKLHSAPNQHSFLAVKKASRAALILIPLFGLHFILIPLRPAPGTSGENIYQVVSALLTGLQGLCVAVLFCFTNHDVVIAIRTQFSRVFRTDTTIAMTGVTVGESLMNARENVL